MAMQDEYDPLIKNNTWDLVPPPSGVNIIRSMWIFRHKLCFDGSFECYKARLVMMAKRNSLHVSSFGFRDPVHPDYVCKLRKSVYGLKQASRVWYQRFADHVSNLGFVHSKSDHSLFIYKYGSNTAYLLLYVDDIILTTSSESIRQSIMSSLNAEFSMKDLVRLSYFLGIVVTYHTSGLFLSHKKYVEALISRAGMSSCNLSATPIDTKSKLGSTSGTRCDNPLLFRSLAGALQYLTLTSPDISYAVQ
ncbi:transmembrane signal receptor [Lithospermum erythrorhizon]|uniref:Transmembrane signal receptor n=1 Tax=Lithospermum erythrorhizon TaxID=34254 RepID=A0AAV3RMS3_LITER